jgi:drug/metabolite transporter (DMT)-like permease
LAALLFALCCLPFEIHWRASGIELPSDAATWSIVIISGLIQYAVAFSAYMFALSKISANLSGSFLNLTPVFGVTIAFVALGERLTALQMLGAGVAIAAVYLIHGRSDGHGSNAEILS